MLTDLATLDVAEHVGWIVDEPREYVQRAAACLAQGAQDGDKLFLLGPHGSLEETILDHGGVAFRDPGSVFLDGGRLDPKVMVARFREQTALARAQGYRGLRVVADMDWLLTALPSATQLMEFEQRLDQVVVETGAIIVCAYRHSSFDSVRRAAVMCVHPQELGRGSAHFGFRIWNGGASHWYVDGEVDLRNAAAFEAALRTVVESREAMPVSLDCAGLEFIDVAGLRVIARLAHDAPALDLVVQRPSVAMRTCWKLLGFDATAPRVEMTV